MILRLIHSLTGRATGATVRAGGGSSSLPLPAHQFPPRVEPESADQSNRFAIAKRDAVKAPSEDDFRDFARRYPSAAIRLILDEHGSKALAEIIRRTDEARIAVALEGAAERKAKAVWHKAQFEKEC